LRICRSASASASRLSSRPLAAEHHFPVAVVLGDRHHHLAGDITAEDDHVGLVEAGRVDELAPADLGSVNVGGEENPHADHPTPSRGPSAHLHDLQRLRVLCNV